MCRLLSNNEGILSPEWLHGIQLAILIAWNLFPVRPSASSSFVIRTKCLWMSVCVCVCACLYTASNESSLHGHRPSFRMSCILTLICILGYTSICREAGKRWPRCGEERIGRPRFAYQAPPPVPYFFIQAISVGHHCISSSVSYEQRSRKNERNKRIRWNGIYSGIPTWSSITLNNFSEDCNSRLNLGNRFMQCYHYLTCCQRFSELPIRCHKLPFGNGKLFLKQNVF